MARGFAGCCGEANVAGAIPGTHFSLLCLNDTLCKKSTSVNLIRGPEQAPGVVWGRADTGVSALWLGEWAQGLGSESALESCRGGHSRSLGLRGEGSIPPPLSGESVVCGIVPWTGSSSAGKRRFSETPAPREAVWL